MRNNRCLRDKADVAWRWHTGSGVAVMGVARGPAVEDLSGEQRMPGVHSGRVFVAACAALVALALSAWPAGATSRIKDLANIEGVRQNQLIGYGLVVGLNGTGDTLNNVPFTKQSLTAMLERLGADGNVYAVGQGSVAINGFQAEGEAAKIVRGVPTVGRIANGAIIEREIDFALNRLNEVRLALRNADFTTAKRIAAAINDFIGTSTAEPLDSSTVQINVPKQYNGNVVSLLTELEQLQIEPDLAAKIVIDERSGIIVMGRDVRVSTVAVVREGVSLQQLVDGLNSLGIGPRDLIAILQAIKAAGAIQAEIEVM